MYRPKYRRKITQKTSKEDRVALVTQAMADGHSYKTAAKALGTTLGSIARICRDAGIASANPAPAMSKSAKVVEPQPAEKVEVAAPEVKKTLVPKVAVPKALPAEVPRKIAPVPNLVRPKLAASEATQCTEKIGGNVCAYERLPDSLKCMLHVSKKKRN